MKEYAADLHIHTALSPCADGGMTPPAIVRQALLKGLAMIAICDHNAAGNVAAVQGAAGGRLAVIAGMELTTSEEVHVLGLFPDGESALRAGEEAQRTLPGGRDARMLSSATGFDVGAGVGLVKRYGGLAVAAHVNKQSFNVFSQLGLFPSGAGFDAVELCAARRPPAWQAEIDILELPAIRSSDAHFLADIGSQQTSLRMAGPTFEELAMAIRGADGRGVV